MNKKQKTTPAITAGAIFGALTWVALIAAKALGCLPGMRWSLVVFGLVWIPVAITLAVYAISEAAALIRWLREMEYRIHTARMLKDAMHGMTLNTLGPVFGVERHPGEINRHYEQRILFAAARGGKAYLKRQTAAPRPATGEKLDMIAAKNGLKRNKDESDRQLQDRIREAVMKRLNEQLEGGKA